MRALAGQLLTGFGLLTRLPLGRLLPAPDEVEFAACVWSYPVVGGVVGALGGAVFWVAARLGLSPSLAAAWTLAAMLLLTGGLHEDGLADCADGFGGGRTIARKLEIMRDSRIGSFGALALMLSLAIRGLAIAAIAQPARVTLALIAACALGRAAILVPLLRLRPARTDGLAAALRAIPASAALGTIAVALIVAMLTLPARQAALALALTLATAVAMAQLARTQIGGHTGDVLGATEIVVECVLLSVAV
jgi:adenosylcobinamide-GDP ribazoletransferase